MWSSLLGSKEQQADSTSQPYSSRPWPRIHIGSNISLASSRRHRAFGGHENQRAQLRKIAPRDDLQDMDSVRLKLMCWVRVHDSSSAQPRQKACDAFGGGHLVHEVKAAF